MIDHLAEIKKREAGNQSELKKEYEAKLAVEKSQAAQDHDRIASLRLQVDSIIKDENEVASRLTAMVHERLADLETRLTHMIEKLLNESRVIQIATESRIQSQLRNMIEKFRDEIAGQLREIERDQIRKSEFDFNAQLLSKRLGLVETTIEQYNSLLGTLVDVVAEPKLPDHPHAENDAKSKSETESTNQEKNLLDTMTEITRFRRHLRHD